MSISAMKQALEALEEVQRYDKTSEWFEKKVSALRQAIAEAEKQEPVAKYSDIVSDGGLDPRNVHASDISQECVDETAKGGHEWVGLDDDIPGLGLVTEEFYNGMIFAEDILREKNT